MILSNPEKYLFIPEFENDEITYPDGLPQEPIHYIDIYTIWGKKLYSIKKQGINLTMNGYIFSGSFDALKIFRREDHKMGTLTVRLICEHCGDAVYNLSAKLPSLFIIKTDFKIEKE